MSLGHKTDVEQAIEPAKALPGSPQDLWPRSEAKCRRVRRPDSKAIFRRVEREGVALTRKLDSLKTSDWDGFLSRESDQIRRNCDPFRVCVDRLQPDDIGSAPNAIPCERTLGVETNCTAAIERASSAAGRPAHTDEEHDSDHEGGQNRQR